ncbi:hypothetical protein D3C86_2256290 [compost metagenome]
MVQQPTFGHPCALGNRIESGSPLPYLNKEGFVGIQDGIPGNWFSWHRYIIP